MPADPQQHAIPGIAQIIAAQGGLPAVRIQTPQTTGLVYLHGAHVAAWKPAGFDEVLWLSQKSMYEAGKPIRGGVPLCFPWFGPRKDAPAHGYARLASWEVESIRQTPAGVTVSLVLHPDAALRAAVAGEFTLRHRVTFGSELIMALELANTGSTPVAAEEALHTYFAVGDVRQVRVTGLAGTRYLDKVDGAKEKTQAGDITITGETDRVYLDTGATVTIEDPSKRRRISVAKEHSLATVVWNPWIAKAKAMPDFGDDEWPGMMCVETCNVGQHALRVPAGQTHVMTARISVAAL